MESYKSIVEECYRGILKREVGDLEVLDQASSALKNGMPLSQFIHSMLNSVEYQNIQGSGSGFSGFTPACADLGDRRLWVDLSDMSVSRVCLLGNYEPHETNFVRNHLSEGDTFIDIGANIGWFSTLAATLVGPKGQVHAFEPRDQTRGLLTRSIQDNGFEERVTIHGYPLAAERVETRLLWMSDTNNPGGSRLARDDHDSFEGMAGQSVTTVPLDDVEIDGRVTLVKLDVEGAEGIVLRGARQFLTKHKPIILTEVSELAFGIVSKMSLQDYADLIHSMGYNIHALEGDEAGRVLQPADLKSEHPFNVVLLPA